MSNILKGILTESNSVYGHSDPAREYGADEPSYPKRGRHSQTDDDEYDPYGLIRQEKDFAKGRAMKAAAAKAQRDSDHNRLATGTNEGLGLNPGTYTKDISTSITSSPHGPAATAASHKGSSMVDFYDRQDKESLAAYQLKIMDRQAELELAKKLGGMPPTPTARGTGIFSGLTSWDFQEWLSKHPQVLDAILKATAPATGQSTIPIPPVPTAGQTTMYNYTDKSTGVAEGIDDPWGDQGNFAGDKPVSIGGVSIKNIQVGDTVKYLGQPSKVVAMSKDRKHSRIAITKGMGTVTQDVLTSDLQQLGQVKAIREDDTTRMKMDQYYDLADAIQEKLRHAIQIGDKARIQELNKQRDELDARVKQYGLMPEDVAEGSKKEEEYGPEWDEKIKRIGQMAKEGPRKTVWDPVKRVYKTVPVKQSGIKQGINEFSPGATGPKGPKDYGQPNSSRYIGGNKFVVGTTNNYVLTATIDKWGLEWDEDDEIWFLDSPGAAHIADASEGEIELPPPREQRNQIHDLVTDYLNARNSADLQKVALYYGHTPDGEMATNEAVSANRFNSKQEVINHFVKNGKSAAAGAAAWERGYRGSSNKPIELKKPPQRSYHDDLDDKRYSSTFENLGDQLKSKSLEALTQLKQQIEQKRMDDLAQWEQDFKNNVASKMRSQPIRSPEATPVAQPGEKHSVLKSRLSQLNNAIQKQELLDKLVDRLERKGLMTPAMQNDTDTRMHVRYGAKDNYESLNKKLDNAIQTLQNRLNIRKISGLKEVHDERDEYDNPRQGRDYGKGNLFVDPGSNEFKKEVHIGANDGELGRPKNLKGISKALPADAFGRTTGKIPDSARPTSNPDPFPPAKILKNHEKWIYPPKSNKSVDEADMNRRGFLGNMGKAAGAGALAAAGLGGAGNAQAFKGTIPAPAPSISEDEAEAQIKELRSKAYKELASMMWNVWPKILDTTFGANTSQDKPATPEEIGKMLGYRLAEYADDYRQKVRAIKVAAGVRDPQSLNKTTAAIYVNEQEIDEEKQRLDPKCWTGYKKQGTKMKGDTRVNNCVPVKESSILAGIKKV